MRDLEYIVSEALDEHYADLDYVNTDEIDFMCGVVARRAGGRYTVPEIRAEIERQVEHER